MVLFDVADALLLAVLHRERFAVYLPALLEVLVGHAVVHGREKIHLLHDLVDATVD